MIGSTTPGPEPAVVKYPLRFIQGNLSKESATLLPNVDDMRRTLQEHSRFFFLGQADGETNASVNHAVSPLLQKKLPRTGAFLGSGTV